MSSGNQGATPGRRRRVPDWDPASPTLGRQTYVLKPDWLEVLAGDNPRLRDGDGVPMVTVISTAAGLDRSRLSRVRKGEYALTTEVSASLVNFLVTYRNYTEDTARAALFERSALAGAAA